MSLFPLTQPKKKNMSSTKKKLRLKNTVSINIGCNNSCWRRKLSHIFNHKPKPKTSSFSCSSSTSVQKHGRHLSALLKNEPVHEHGDFERINIGGESVAVEKESDDPYLDFRQSMLQMICENEIYSKDDLRELLSCFLQLNSPIHHGIIVRAFVEIWNAIFSVTSSSPYCSAASSSKLRFAAAGATCKSREFNLS